MRHSGIDLTMNTYTDLALLDVHAATNALPPLNARDETTEEQKATGTDDSKVVGVVGLVGLNQQDLSKANALKQNERQRNASRLVPPRTCPNETIQDNSGGFDDSGRQSGNVKKPRKTQGHARNSEWAMRGSNPRPSRCKRDALAN